MLALIFPGGLAGLAIAIIVFVAVVAIVFIACKNMGVPIPPWVMQVLGVVLIAVVCIVAIKFLLTI